jgi:hypothetical protein
MESSDAEAACVDLYPKTITVMRTKSRQLAAAGAGNALAKPILLGSSSEEASLVPQIESNWNLIAAELVRWMALIGSQELERIAGFATRGQI